MRRVKDIIILLLLIAILGVSSLTAKAQGPAEVSSGLDFYIEMSASEFNISPYLLKSLIWQESGYKGNNLTQITYIGWFKDATDYIGSTDYHNDYNNIRICAYTLMKYAEEYPGEPYLWCMMWNEGKENALKHPQRVSYYARTIVDRADEWSYEADLERGDLYG